MRQVVERCEGSGDGPGESDQRFRLLSEAIPAMVWICTPEGEGEYFNQSWHRYTGLNEAESVGTGWTVALHPDDLREGLAKWRDAVASRTPYVDEMRYRRFDGTFRWHVVRALPVVAADGGVMRWVGMSADIEEQKQTEEALRDSTEALTLAQRGAAAGVWDWNLTSGSMRYSDEYAALYRLPRRRENPTYADWLAGVFPDDRARVDREIQQAIATQRDLEVEFRIDRPDGERRWLLSKGRVVKDRQGKGVRLIGITFDITDRKASEEHILELLREAERREQDLRDKQAQLLQAAKLASIGELATGVAHELNNPLNNIGLLVGNMLDALGSEAVDREALASNLRVTAVQVERAARIVDQLRRFGRMSTSERLTVCVNDVVRSSLGLIHEQLRLRNIRVTTSLSSEDPCVEGNGLELEQVIVNVLANARDAVMETPVKEIAIETAAEDRTVFIRVRDTGCGMSEDVRMRVFDPFFTTKDVGKGTGLGLSLSYGIIKDHHGHISVFSRPGRGSTFVIQLPLLGRERRTPTVEDEHGRHEMTMGKAAGPSLE